jgi:general nucleoside transport system permease protein
MLSSSPPPASRRSPAILGGLGWFYLLGGVLVLWVAWATSPEALSTLRFARLGSLMLSTRWCMILCAVLFLVTGMLCYSARPRSRVHRVSLGTNALALVCLVLVWASTGRRLEVLGILAQSVRLATPIALGALAGILCERSGVVNIAIEGMMLSAACLGFMIALYAANAWVGVLAAVAAGGTMAALHAILSIQWRVEQIISGIVINMLAVGLTGFIRRTVLLHNVREAPAVLPTWTLPVISDLPVLRQLCGRHQPLVYAMLLLVLLVHILLFYTRWGLRTRAVGEHPRAADTVGIHVFTVRYANVILGGMIAGVGGAWFSLETVGNFEDLMTNGKGFIALAAMIFGKWNPLGALGGALLFGFADALQIKLQIAGVNVPYQILGMVPYLVTMIVLAGVIGRALPPAASGIPYDKGS